MALSLGVVASATQLAAYALSIVSFITAAYERLHDAPEQYREYEVQLKLLIDIVGSVQKVPALQTPEVEYHLKNTAAEVRTLQSLLCCRAVSSNTSFLLRRGSWKAIQGSEQRRISAHLERLYKKNTALQLYITTINTTQLSSVNQTVDKIMANTTPNAIPNTNKETKRIGETEEIQCLKGRMPPGGEIPALGLSQFNIVPLLLQSETLNTDPETLADLLRALEYVRTQPRSSGHNRPGENNESSGNSRNYAGWQSTGCKNFYGDVKICGTNRVTAGNEFKSHSATPVPETIKPPQQCGHFYKKFTVTTNGATNGENRFHGGDVGAGGVTGGHIFEGFDFEGPTLLHLGNFETVELKRAQGFTN